MNTPDNAAITRVLRSLDAADPDLDGEQRAHAVATLERILTTDPHTPTTTSAPAPRLSRRRLRRVVLAAGLVAVPAVVVAGPIISRDSEAFASWSPTPVELTGAERTAAVDACLVHQSDSGGDLDFAPDSKATVLVAEARGGWNYVIYTVVGASGHQLQGSCLVPDDLVAEPRPGEGGVFGSLSQVDEVEPAPGRDVARQDTYGAGAVDDDAFVYAEGRAGADVVGIEVTTPTGQEIQASIDNGHWAVWWPAGDNSMQNPNLTGAPTYEVTLRDGTVTDAVVPGR